MNIFVYVSDLLRLKDHNNVDALLTKVNNSVGSIASVDWYCPERVYLMTLKLLNSEAGKYRKIVSCDLLHREI